MSKPALFVTLVLGLSACGDTPPQEPMTAENEIPVEAPEAVARFPSEDEANANPRELAEPETAPEAEEPTLPTKMGRRLSNQLRQLVGARVALPHVINDTLPSGGNRVLGVMSYSEHEACVGRHEDRAEGRAACQTDEDCIQYGTFAAEFAAPRPRTPEGHGGVLTMLSPQATTDLNLVCAENIEVKRLELVDIDGDGELELMYDATFHSDHDSFRGEGTFSTARRFLRVIRLDGTEQISIPLSTWGGDDEATESQYARRVRFDGTPPALVLEEIEYESMGGTSCPVDDALFATDYERTDSAECTGELVTLTRPYDAECDCWRTAEEAAEAAPAGVIEAPAEEEAPVEAVVESAVETAVETAVEAASEAQIEAPAVAPSQ